MFWDYGPGPSGPPAAAARSQQTSNGTAPPVQTKVINTYLFLKTLIWSPKYLISILQPDPLFNPQSLNSGRLWCTCSRPLLGWLCA